MGYREYLLLDAVTSTDANQQFAIDAAGAKHLTVWIIEDGTNSITYQLDWYYEPDGNIATDPVVSDTGATALSGSTDVKLYDISEAVTIKSHYLLFNFKATVAATQGVVTVHVEVFK